MVQSPSSSHNIWTLVLHSDSLRVGHCATLDKATGSIEQALLELDRQKLRIRERINCTTADDMERGLLNDTIVSAKGSVLSIGMSPQP